MSSPLVTHAKQHVWCATNQDYQHHVNLPRITPNRGVINKYPVLWDVVCVPPTTSRRDYFHFYQIGNLPVETFNLVLGVDKWVNYMDLNKTSNILIDVYMVSGAIIPRDHIWLTRLYNGNIIVAIKNDFKYDYGVCNKTNFNGVPYLEKFTLDNSAVIMRFYSNAYFSSVGYLSSAVSSAEPIRTVYTKINNSNDFNTFMDDCSAVENIFGKAGLGVYYLDGFVINRPLGFMDEYTNHTLGFMWDESFKFEQYFDIKGLPAFISTKNLGVRKYLLTCNKTYTHVDYHDDVDFYIVNKVTGKGIYYNRNARFGLTMITHNSYALNADVIESYIQAHEFLGSIDNCAVRVMVRHGGRKNGLFNQKNRIEELYRLDYEDIIGAHVNTPSLVPVWQATTLEKSAYVELMSAPSHLIDDKMVIDAYGYNGLCTSFANPVVPVIGGEFLVPDVARSVDKHTGLGNRSVYCYDANGVYRGYFVDTTVSSVIRLPTAHRGTTTTVECLNAVTSTTEVQAWVNDDVVSDDLTQYGFRCYVSPSDVNGVLHRWEDVTDSNLYTYTKSSPGKRASISWNWNLLSQMDLYPAVKTNKNIHLYNWSKSAAMEYDGCLEFEVKASFYWNKNLEYRTLTLPQGVVDVFVNGLSLIRNVDYIMNWPRIVIINRNINNTPDLKVTIRSYGFGDPRSVKPFVPNETGFVKGGMISINGVYDVRNSKCVRLIVDNKLVDVKSASYGERAGPTNFVDGKAYSVCDYVIPLDNLLKDNITWTLYKESLDIDKRVSDYLTPRLPEFKTIKPVINVTRLPVISPVVSSILHVFKNGHDFDNLVPDNYTYEDVRKWFKPFAWLLDYDPAHLNLDENYFRIEPHASSNVMTISQKQYEFLEWVIELHLNNRVDLTTNVQIG